MKNIVVAIEFEKQTDVLIAKAVELAEKFNSKLWLVHVVSHEHIVIDSELPPEYIINEIKQEIKSDKRFTDNYCKELKKKKIKSECVEIQGATTTIILREANKFDADLIIIGHHPHGFLYETFIGSKSADLVKMSNVPVMVVPLEK